ncbi:MAG TPA: peptidase S41, partial [Bacteroidetes bacterium]|nr:peptidase S41 [Bacteroidota bacterium]
VRDNGGGNSGFAKIIVNRFADNKRQVSFVRYRNGPDHDNFTDYIPQYIFPEGKRQYTKPVAVLTNRKSFSATEYFVLAMRTLPHVTIIGDTTGGGSGIPISRELPNGWAYRLPRSMQLTPDSVNYEGIGLAPYIFVVNPYTDKIFSTDTQLVRAVHFLEQGRK